MVYGYRLFISVIITLIMCRLGFVTCCFCLCFTYGLRYGCSVDGYTLLSSVQFYNVFVGTVCFLLCIDLDGVGFRLFLDETGCFGIC